MARTLVDIFEVKGFAAVAVHSGEEALVRLDAGRFNCVLSDIKMPGLNGVDLLRAVKNVDRHLPVVLMTAYTSDVLVTTALQTGVVAVLTKPLDIPRLIGFLNHLSEGRTIVVVSEDESLAQEVECVTEETGWQMLQVDEPSRLVEVLDSPGKVAVLDLRLWRTFGLHLLAVQRRRERHPPVLLAHWPGIEDGAVVEAGTSMSQSAVVTRPLEVHDFNNHLTELFHRELGALLGRSDLDWVR
jgi:DNA-binding NtrC family response regulator